MKTEAETTADANLIAAIFPKPKRPKLTAERLEKVGALQSRLAECAGLAQDLANDELNGWTPGTPTGGRSPRVEPLEKLSRDLDESAQMLEGLYSEMVITSRYAYDGDVIPVEIWHLIDRNTTFCGIDLRPLRWRFSEQLPLTGEQCPECAAAREKS